MKTDKLLSSAYNTLLLGLSPALLTGLLVKGLRSRQSLHRWKERFGRIPFSVPSGAIWIHAVSVGEVQAAIPLIHELKSRRPERQILVTTTTPTGSKHVESQLGSSVLHCYLPLDLPFSVKSFLNAARPALAVVMENESWPNLFWQCRERGIPVVLANARISPSTFRTYQRIHRLMQSLLRDVTVLAKSDEDADRFLHLGSDPGRTRICGNLKYDLRLNQGQVEQGRELRNHLGDRSFVWIGASTRQGEEEQLLQAHASVLEKHPDALLIVVPRHPERFAEADRISRDFGFSLHRRSQGLLPRDKPSVYLGDSMGELPLYYAAADLAFVGGSLVPVGGHNPLEPAALKLPVIMGPHAFNFTEITRMLTDREGLIQIDEAGKLAPLLLRLISDPEFRRQTGERAGAVVERNQGAVRCVLSCLDQLLDSKG
jgi:3-deoxy-D-manno-octulosonic-acid transferase